jgi:hypothetical protein
MKVQIGLLMHPVFTNTGLVEAATGSFRVLKLTNIRLVRLLTDIFIFKVISMAALMTLGTGMADLMIAIHQEGGMGGMSIMEMNIGMVLDTVRGMVMIPGVVIDTFMNTIGTAVTTEISPLKQGMVANFPTHRA